MGKATPLKASYRFWAAAIVLLAFGLRLLDASHRSLWFDEAIEYLTASTSLAHLPAAIISLNYQPPLFSFLLHGWLLAGIHPLWLRYLPLILSLFTLLGMMQLTRVVASRRAALLAGLITAVLPTDLYYAQDLGEYSLLVCCLTWSLFFLYLACDHNRWRDWLLWMLFSLLAVYAHYGAAIVVAPLALLTLGGHGWQRRWTAVRRQLAVMGLALMVSWPLFVYFLPFQIRRVSETAFAYTLAAPLHEARLLASGVADALAYQLIGWPISAVPRWTVSLTLGVAVLLWLWRGRRVEKRPFIWFLAVYLFYFLLVRQGLYLGFGMRYGLIFTPFFILIAALLLAELWLAKKAVAAALLGLLLALSLYATPHPTLSQLFRRAPAWSPTEQMEPVFRYWRQQARPEQPTFVYYGAVPAFRYYLQYYQMELPAFQPSPYVECTAVLRTPTCQTYNLFYSRWVRSLTAEEQVADLAQTMGGAPEQFWLIFAHVHQGEDEALVTLLQSRYQIEDHFRSHGADVYLFTRK
ncbi:MAG: glycosyltransferase family 39 protein [Ardenticatenaceae bacterium]|nr:glycosyltransferase family 39 protein [Ardenticatenaceae bacterium]